MTKHKLRAIEAKALRLLYVKRLREAQGDHKAADKIFERFATALSTYRTGQYLLDKHGEGTR